MRFRDLGVLSNFVSGIVSDIVSKIEGPLVSDKERSLLFQFKWPLSNLRRRWTRSLLPLSDVAIALALLLAVASFYGGYRAALSRGADQPGFEILDLLKKLCRNSRKTVALATHAGTLAADADRTIALSYGRCA